ncbi:MAG: phosphomannomutase/phosphoglucomutase [Halieaceae bacterium]|nr:phosphomannomutase/phosphoglucomutase [Halieaceae bacterium]
MLQLKKRNKKKAAPVNAEGGGTGTPMGIVAKGNALITAGAAALLAALLPTVLGFGYLLLLRDPGLQEIQIAQLSSAYAQQQAANIQQTISQLKDRIESASRSPLALSAIASESESDIALVERAILDYFPEVISLRVIPIGDMGTAGFSGGNSGLRNHIEVDLVRRASERDNTQPESYKFEDQWLTSIGARVLHPRTQQRSAVIIVTIENERLEKEMKAPPGASGKFTLIQSFLPTQGKKRTQVVAANGSGAEGEYTRYADVPDTNWSVGFSPSSAMLESLALSPSPLHSVMGLIVMAIVLALGLLLWFFPRKLKSEINRVISASDQKSSLSLSIPELVPIAKQLRRATLSTLRQSSSNDWTIPQAEVETIASSPPERTLPDASPAGTAADLDLDLDLDLNDDNIALGDPERQAGVPHHVFRAYDIRGKANTELTDELVKKIGMAIGTIAGERGEQTIIVGCDGRVSTPRIKSVLLRGLMSAGRDVVDIGLVPTPLLYFATRRLNYHSGVMVTGSHNPADQNGLKIVMNQETIGAGGIEEIRNRVIEGSFSTGEGTLTSEEVIPAYVDEVLHDIAISVPLRVVVDAGNGATSDIAPALLEELGCEVIPLNCVVDGSFPGHPPDTSNEDNLAQLAEKVVDARADFGVAFDGDGDRLAVVTGSGRIIRSDVLLMLYAEDVVSRNPGTDVVFDVKCSRLLSSLITQHGGRPVLWKTGHAFMKEKMRETNALLGGEFSGHIFFGERWYGFDDGIYAACRLAEILSTHGESLDESIGKFPETVNTPEIIIPIDDNYKFALVEKIAHSADFSAGKVNNMDGIRVDFSNGWGLIRASNTGPALTARFEADTQENLDIIKEEFRAQIALVDPTITLNF